MPDFVSKAAEWFVKHTWVKWTIILLSIFAMLAIVGFNVFVVNQKENCSTACKSQGYDHSVAHHQQCACYRRGLIIKDW